MEREKIESMLSEATAELAVAKRQAAVLQNVVDSLTSLVSSFDVTMTAPTSTAVNDVVLPLPPNLTFPKPREAVLAVLQSQPGVGFQTRDLIAQIRENGQYNPYLASKDNSYATAVRRLSLEPDSPIVKNSEGRWMFSTNDSPSEQVEGITDLTGVSTS